MPPAYLKAPPAVTPNRPVRWWCDGKATFDSALLAMEVAARSKTKGNRCIYRCGTCGRFHVGGETDRFAATTSKAAKAALIRSR